METILVIFFLYAVSFGPITAFVASTKRVKSRGWLIAGAIFGPIALLAAVGIAPEDARIDQIRLEAGGKECFACREVIKSAAVKCRHCGTTQNSDSPTS